MSTAVPNPDRDGVALRNLPPGVTFVAVQWIDVHGTAKAKLIPRAAWPATCAPGGGAGFAAFVDPDLARGSERPQLVAVPDPSTLIVLPQRPDTALAFSTVFDGDEVATCDARAILARVQATAAASGLLPIAAINPQFFLLRRCDDGGLAPFDEHDVLDRPGYDLQALLRTSPILRSVVGAMQALDWQVSALHHGEANGQFEIDLAHAEALKTADRLTVLRTMIADIAETHGAIATFMPKPLAGCTGSSAHVHMSALRADGENAFADDADARGLGLSTAAYAFIAGVLRHARALSALTMPTVNSYRRPYSSAGSRGATQPHNAIVYGARTRAVMLRVPGPGRFEHRAVDGSCNPYLALAGMIAAGLDGVERRLDPGDPLAGPARPDGGPTLPRTLAEALDALEGDDVLRDALGEQATAEFVAAKRDDWGSYMDSVSAWEQETYLRRV